MHDGRSRPYLTYHRDVVSTPTTPPGHERLAVEFVGHSTVVIEMAGLTVLTDPLLRSTFGHLRRVTVAPDVARLRQAKAVLISHLHHDHLDLPSMRMLGSDLTVVVPLGAGDLLRRTGFANVHELVAGESVTLGTISVQAVEASHRGKRLPFGPMAPALGYRLSTPGRSVYFAGDTDLFEGMSELQELDVALLPVWGWGPNLRGGHLDPRTAAEAVTRMRPKVAIPIHWGTFWPRGMGRFRRDRLTAPPFEFQRFVETSGAGARPVVLQPGERWTEGDSSV